MPTPLMDHQAQRRLADQIVRAMDSGRGLEPPSDTLDFSLTDSYAIQQMVIADLLARGAVVVGHKIGFTSEAMRVMYGVDEPDFGKLLDTMAVPDGGTILTAGLVDPRVEPEITFRLGRRLQGPGVTVADVLGATDEVLASLEVIDSRVGSERCKGIDSVADNAGAGRFVLAASGTPPTDLDFERLAVDFRAGDEHYTGTGADVMDHPAAAVAWLANALADLDEALEPGALVMSGAITRSVKGTPGTEAHADFGQLGTVSVRFA